MYLTDMMKLLLKNFVMHGLNTNYSLTLMTLKQKTQMKIFTVGQTTVEQLDNFDYQLLPVYREGIEVGACHRDRANCGNDPDRMVWTAAIGFDISPSFTSIVSMLKWCDDLLGYETIGVF